MSMVKELFLDIEKECKNELDTDKAAIFADIICHRDEGAISVISEMIKEDAWSKLETLLNNNIYDLKLVDESRIISKTFFILCGEDNEVAKFIFYFIKSRERNLKK